ncbi:hypothetical protein HPB48_014373 [Haemaphysalis longicornis]|uniref:Uncharacterized protein n=1 Tax=Haemaphysalis longicornis TaxID=44386 RepID=A0A9J6G3B7_HAELO|nr:hypothetical protein HPB48_014373 [Haemaphysalis longicornis]
MTWGARSLVPSTAAILLFHVLPRCAAAARHDSPSRSTGPHAAAQLADRGKRESDSMPDIFIEHEDRDPRVLPLLVAVAVIGGLIAVALLLLALHLLVRLAESHCCKCRYQRLRREDSDTGHRFRKKRDEGQAFTYVDMSRNECAHLDHHGEETEAPRFAVSLHKAGKIDAGDVPSCRDQGPATRLAPVRTERAEDSTKSIAATTAASNLDEPPKKKICAQHIGRLPGSWIGGANDAEEGFSEYEERCTQYKSAAPEFEINMRDRIIRTRPHGGILSPSGIRAPHAAAGGAPGVWSETNQVYYRDEDGTHWHRHPRIWNSDSSSPQHFHEATSPSLSLSAIRPPVPGDSVSRKTSSRGQQGSSMSGHGRYYEEHALGDKDRMDVASASKFLSNRDVDYKPTMQSWPTVVLSSSSREPTADALVELPETRVIEYRNPSASSLKSMKNRRFVEDEVSVADKAAAPAEKEHKESGTPRIPMQLDTTPALAGLPSPPSSAPGTLRASGSNEMRVQVPKIIALFDTPQKVQRLTARSDGSSAECSVQNRSWFAEIPYKDTPKSKSVSLPSPRKTTQANETIKLPEPPLDRPQKEFGAEPSYERSAMTTGSLHSEQKQHDVHDSTEPFSVDEASQQRTSGSELLSATDMSAGQRRRG